MNKIENIPTLTGLRFIAACLVFLSHAVQAIGSATCWYFPILTTFSAEGMSLFFVLSGFVIHYNYSAAIKQNVVTGLQRFYIARFARLVPLFLVCLLMDLMLTLHRTHSIPHLIEVLPFYLTLSQSWFYLILNKNNLIYQFDRISQVSWSISTECFFYMCYPLLALVLFKLNNIKIKLLVLAILSLMTVSLIAWCHAALPIINNYAISTFGPYADYYQHNQDSFYRWLLYFSPYIRISEFFAGTLLASIYMRLNLPLQKPRGLFVTLFSISAIIFTHYFIWYLNPTSWLVDLHRCFGFAPSVMLLIFCCVRYENAITRLIANPWLLLGGEISYSIYLLHLPIIDYLNFHYIKDMSIPVVAKFALIFAATMIIAYASYQVVEVPGRNLLRRSFSKKSILTMQT